MRSSLSSHVTACLIASQVVERVEKLTAVGRRQEAPQEAPPRRSSEQSGGQPSQQPAAAEGHRTVLQVEVPRIVTDAATSPFSEAAAVKSPLAQAKDLVGKVRIPHPIAATAPVRIRSII